MGRWGARKKHTDGPKQEGWHQSKKNRQIITGLTLTEKAGSRKHSG